MGEIAVFTPDRLSPSERFRRVIRALSTHDREGAAQLQAATPHLEWTGPDVAFTERLRAAAEMVQAFTADLNVAVTKLIMLTAFERTLRDFDAVLQNEMAFAWTLGWEAAGGAQDADLTPHQEKLAQLQEACRIPDTFQESIHDVQTQVASLWDAWRGFTRAAWRLRPEEPIKAWGPVGVDDLLTHVGANATPPDPVSAALYRQPYDETWNQTLATLAGRLGGR